MNTDFLSWLLPLLAIGGFILFRRLSQVSVAEARALVDAGARLIDVRSRDEFSAGHLPGAINVPVDQLSARLAALGAKDEPKVVYCASGSRSAFARSVLKGHGFTRVYNLGAMSRWG